MQVAATPRDVAVASDIVITMLPSGLEVRDTVFGPDGLIKGFRRQPAARHVFVRTSVRERDSSGLAPVGVSVVDAPVSGAEAGAIAAELVFMVGGDDASVARVKPLLDVLGRKAFTSGPWPRGTR